MEDSWARVKLLLRRSAMNSPVRSPARSLLRRSRAMRPKRSGRASRNGSRRSWEPPLRADGSDAATAAARSSAERPAESDQAGHLHGSNGLAGQSVLLVAVSLAPRRGDGAAIDASVHAGDCRRASGR
jgi:hypothetical protein